MLGMRRSVGSLHSVMMTATMPYCRGDGDVIKDRCSCNDEHQQHQSDLFLSNPHSLLYSTEKFPRLKIFANRWELVISTPFIDGSSQGSKVRRVSVTR